VAGFFRAHCFYILIQQFVGVQFGAVAWELNQAEVVGVGHDKRFRHLSPMRGMAVVPLGGTSQGGLQTVVRSQLAATNVSSGTTTAQLWGSVNAAGVARGGISGRRCSIW